MPKATSATVYSLNMPVYDGENVHCADVVRAVMEHKVENLDTDSTISLTRNRAVCDNLTFEVK